MPKQLSLTGLEEGDYTKITPRISQIADGIRETAARNDASIRKELSKYLSTLKYNDERKRFEFRKRNASQIIQSGYTTGCTDTGIVFLTLARALGIPSLYVETLETDWLTSQATGVSGYIFADINVDNKWMPYEPHRGFCRNGYALGDRKYTVIGKGVDFSQLHLLENDEFNPKPTSLANLMEVARSFRKK